MANRLPIYKVVLNDESDEIDFNAVVDFPAHSKPFHLFNSSQQKRIRQEFNDEKMIVTGVAVATDVPIYRRDEDGREFYLYFSAEETKKFAQRLFKRGYMNNVNEMHDSNRLVNSMELIESYFIDETGVNGPKAPEAFNGQNLKNGSWVVSYQVTDRKTWELLRSGVYAGFSVEGWFTLEKENFNNIKMNKNKKGFFERMKAKLAADNAATTFGMAQTTDGATLVWDGDAIEVGKEVRIKSEDETEILAPEGTVTVLAEDGSSMILVIDANGMVETMEVVEAASEEDEFLEQLTNEIAELKASNVELKASNVAFATAQTETNEKIEVLSEIITKFKKDPTPGKTPSTWKNPSGK